MFSYPPIKRRGEAGGNGVLLLCFLSTADFPKTSRNKNFLHLNCNSITGTVLALDAIFAFRVARLSLRKGFFTITRDSRWGN